MRATIRRRRQARRNNPPMFVCLFAVMETNSASLTPWKRPQGNRETPGARQRQRARPKTAGRQSERARKRKPAPSCEIERIDRDHDRDQAQQSERRTRKAGPLERLTSDPDQPGQQEAREGLYATGTAEHKARASRETP